MADDSDDDSDNELLVNIRRNPVPKDTIENYDQKVRQAVYEQASRQRQSYGIDRRTSLRTLVTMYSSRVQFAVIFARLASGSIMSLWLNFCLAWFACDRRVISPSVSCRVLLSCSHSQRLLASL